IIAEYVVGQGNQSGCLLSVARRRTTQTNPYRTLMHVCHEWRVALMPHALKASGIPFFDDTCTVSEMERRRQRPPTMRRMGALESDSLFRRPF
ncbi:hypothetical protein EV175_000085, partial [Coemansia sp. RSA 1933]